MLLTNPFSLVVETAVTEAHGRARGQRAGAADLSSSAEEWHTVALNITAHLQSQLGEPGIEPLDAPLWQQVREAAPAEQVALVAALVRNAPLVFGDRPKEVTFRRLFAESEAELDAAFGAQCASNFASLQAGGEAPPPAAPDAFERVVLRERDLVMFDSLRAEARAAGAGRSVVGILGSAHLAEVCRLFRESGGFSDDVDHLLTSPPPPAGARGVRRALLERLLCLRVPEEVVAEAEAALGAVPVEDQADFMATRELYGSPRMLLAMLSKEDLPSVAMGRGGTDLWALLQPLRDARPVNGGAGFSAAALALARAGREVAGLPGL